MDGTEGATTQEPALLSAIGLCGLTLSSRSSAGQLCPSSARSSRNHTRARPSGRNIRPACAHGREERKEAPKIETKPLLFTHQTLLHFRFYHPPTRGTCRAPTAGVGHARPTRLKHGPLCHFSFPATMPSSCLRSTRLILPWEQQSSVGSPKQVERYVYSVALFHATCTYSVATDVQGGPYHIHHFTAQCQVKSSTNTPVMQGAKTNAHRKKVRL